MEWWPESTELQVLANLVLNLVILSKLLTSLEIDLPFLCYQVIVQNHMFMKYFYTLLNVVKW